MTAQKVYVKYYDKEGVEFQTPDVEKSWEDEKKIEPTVSYKKYSDDGKNHVRAWKRYVGLQRQGDAFPCAFKVCVQTNKELKDLEAYRSVFWSYEKEVDATNKYNEMVEALSKIVVPDDPIDIEPAIGE